MIHFQYFPSAFDDRVVVPPVEHGDKSKCVGRRRQRVDLPDLFHFCDRFLNAVPLRQIHPMPKERPGSTGIQFEGAVKFSFCFGKVPLISIFDPCQ